VLALLDRRAVLTGAGLALLVAVPPAVVAQVQSDRRALEGSNWVLVLFGVILFGFLLGGFAAARRRPANPLVNGAAASFTAFALVQGYGIVRRLADGEELRWLGIVFAALLAASCGILGAIVASMGSRRTA